MTLTANQKTDFEPMARRIVHALKLRPGERVLIRFDPAYMEGLVYPLRKEIRLAGAVDVGALEYVENVEIIGGTPTLDSAQVKAFGQLLESIDVYLWLAVSKERDLYPAEAEALRGWLRKGGTRREIHFHWRSGSMRADGLTGEHSSELDEVYEKALDIDYNLLSSDQDRAIALLRSGTIRVRTPGGTDLSFRTGDRPFNKQNGDASAERAQVARVLVDREIELPAGVIRVAPLETTVQGRLVIPEARFGNVAARNLRFDFKDGRMEKIEADTNSFEVEAQLAEVGDVARRFREFGLGFNPNLISPENSGIVAYYGYGAGVVRLSIGDNQEIGGAVQGGFVRWFFFPDATVEVNGRVLVRDGKLVNEKN